MDQNATLSAIVARACAAGPMRVAVADAAQEVVLATMRRALEEGLAEPHLVGRRDEIEPLAATVGLSLDRVFMYDSEPEANAAQIAVQLVREGRVDAVMKGNLHTDTFMRVLLDASTGLRVPGQRVSHLFLLEVPGHDRLIGVTDAAINIAPDLTAKAQICQNAVDAFHMIGVGEPRVAVLSAVETVTESITSTLDAASLTLMARRGQITGAIVDGPLAFDNAVSPRAVAEKGIVSKVAGRADILLVPDLVSGNVLAKALEYLGGAWAAGVALGLAAPVVLTSRADTERVVAEALSTFGAVHSLVNVAGGSRPGQTVVDLEPEQWDRLVELNLTSVYLMCRAALPHMEERGSGTIVNVSSGAGLRGMQANPGYVAAKAGVVALTRSLAIDHGPNGIRSNCVAPGPVATPLMRRNRTPDEIAYIARQTLVGRVGEPEELAEVILWLASDDSSYVMGQTISADGGVVAGI